MVRTARFPYQQEWQGLVATMDDALRLHQHQPGSLVALAKCLHQRTGGVISSLSHLIRAAAISAILDASEKISRELLDGIRLDHAAEAVARAEELRSRPVTDDDFVQPGENISETLRLLSAIDNCEDYHRLLGIQRMPHNLKPIASLLTDTDLAAELEAWLQVLPELDPVPINPVDQPATPSERIGVIGTSRAAADGRRLLTAIAGPNCPPLDAPPLTDDELSRAKIRGR